MRDRDWIHIRKNWTDRQTGTYRSIVGKKGEKRREKGGERRGKGGGKKKKEKKRKKGRKREKNGVL